MSDAIADVDIMKPELYAERLSRILLPQQRPVPRIEIGQTTWTPTKEGQLLKLLDRPQSDPAAISMKEWLAVRKEDGMLYWYHLDLDQNREYHELANGVYLVFSLLGLARAHFIHLHNTHANRTKHGQIRWVNSLIDEHRVNEPAYPCVAEFQSTDSVIMDTIMYRVTAPARDWFVQKQAMLNEMFNVNGW